jgi:hypothetical protein
MVISGASLIAKVFLFHFKKSIQGNDVKAHTIRAVNKTWKKENIFLILALNVFPEVYSWKKQSKMLSKDEKGTLYWLMSFIWQEICIILNIVNL